MKQSLKLYAIAVLAVVTVVAMAYLLLRPALKDTSVATVPENEIIVSQRAVLDSIRSIGQWELMSVDVQTDVDTVQKTMLGLVKHRLQRRYYGRISLGIDMTKCNDLQILPPVCVLDSNFIDESRTELIVCESKSMEQDPRLKAAMLAKAKAMMLRDVVSQQRLDECEQKARDEVKRFLNNI